MVTPKVHNGKLLTASWWESLNNLAGPLSIGSNHYANSMPHPIFLNFIHVQTPLSVRFFNYLPSSSKHRQKMVNDNLECWILLVGSLWPPETTPTNGRPQPPLCLFNLLCDQDEDPWYDNPDNGPNDDAGNDLCDDDPRKPFSFVFSTPAVMVEILIWSWSL